MAADRLMNALNNNGVKAKMLVRDKQTTDITVVGLPKSPALWWHFVWERWRILVNLRFSRKRLFEIDIANSGSDITSLREFKEADVIHLSWINQGMLSLRGIKRIMDSGKPVVWTMHDAWPATAICHYTRGCDKFTMACGQCPLLPSGGSGRDLSRKVFNRKKKIYDSGRISFVACSGWLERQARRSALMVGQQITSIPNPIDTRVFHKRDKGEARSRAGLPQDKRLILFVSQRVTDPRKGMRYFVEAMNMLVDEHPGMRRDVGIAVLGGGADELASQLPLPTYPLGYVSDEKTIVSVYNSADVFVLPSLEDNLPNTIMEAMACGVPCVSFDVGGIPEEIDHQRNGYVAAFKDSTDLAHGVNWVLSEADYDDLSARAIGKVTAAYSQQSVAMRYIDIYNKVIKHRRQRV